MGRGSRVNDQVSKNFLPGCREPQPFAIFAVGLDASDGPPPVVVPPGVSKIFEMTTLRVDSRPIWI
jgi:hypothetical protein